VSQLPQSIDAERALLGSMMLYQESVRCASDNGLQEDDFFFEPNRKIFATIMEITEDKKLVELTGVITRLNDTGQITQVGGIDYLMSLADVATAPVNSSHYVELIREKSLLRKLLEVTSNISKDVYNKSYDIDEVFADAESKIHELTRNRQTSDFKKSKEVVSDVVKALVARQGRNEMTGVASGFKDFDHYTFGFQKGDLIILAARPSMGKTAFALNLGLNAGLTNKTVALFSLEMPAEQLVRRFLSAAGQIDGNKLRTGDLEKNEWTKLYDAEAKLTNCEIYIDDNPSIKISEMFSKCRKLQSEKGLDIIIIDYLQLISGPRRVENRQQEVSEISRALKQLAREMDCPVIALSQLSRNVEQRSKENRRPMLSDLRESGSIEQDADLVVFLHCDEYYEKEKPPIRKMEVLLSKHRNGSTGIVELSFNTPFNSFYSFVKRADDGGNTSEK